MTGKALAWLRQTLELQDPRHARLLPMEGLRGCAVTLVFLQHYCVQAQAIGLPPGWTAGIAALLRAYGNYGVELFFVLSGYLIYGGLQRRAPPFARFMARRAQRIYPAFLAVFAAALAMILAMPDAGKLPPGTWQAALYLGMNLALLPGLIPVTRIVEVAWSLSYEMVFYIASAALVLGLGLAAAPRPRRIAVLAVLSAAFLLACLADPADVPVRMMPFFAGMLLAEGVGRHTPPWMAWAAPALAFTLSATLRLPVVIGEMVQTAAFFALCAVCFRGAGLASSALSRTPLRWLGNMSYSYYLVHGFVVRAAMLILARLLPHGMADWLFWALMPALFAATLVPSLLLFAVVEKPLSLSPARPS